jgi:hypothetical protein
MPTSTKQGKKLRLPRYLDRRAASTPSQSADTAHTYPYSGPSPANFTYTKSNTGIDDIFEDILRTQRDHVAEDLRNYVLPQPGQEHSKPVGGNIDYCCQVYGDPPVYNRHTLSRRSHLLDFHRSRWSR